MEPLRVAVCADYPEEEWRSMDRVATMLVGELRRAHADTIAVTPVCPPFVHRATRFVGVGGSRTAFNIDRPNATNLRAEPWKVDAAKLRLALESFAEDNKTSKNVTSLLKWAKPVLEAIEKEQVPSAAPLLKKFLDSYKPESSSLFKGDDKATVKLPVSDT